LQVSFLRLVYLAFYLDLIDYIEFFSEISLDATSRSSQLYRLPGEGLLLLSKQALPEFVPGIDFSM
jgi:hypothetical protein